PGRERSGEGRRTERFVHRARAKPRRGPATGERTGQGPRLEIGPRLTGERQAIEAEGDRGRGRVGEERQHEELGRIDRHPGSLRPACEALGIGKSTDPDFAYAIERYGSPPHEMLECLSGVRLAGGQLDLAPEALAGEG